MAKDYINGHPVRVELTRVGFQVYLAKLTPQEVLKVSQIFLSAKYLKILKLKRKCSLVNKYKNIDNKLRPFRALFFFWYKNLHFFSIEISWFHIYIYIYILVIFMNKDCSISEIEHLSEDSVYIETSLNDCHSRRPTDHWTNLELNLKF